MTSSANNGASRTLRRHAALSLAAALAAGCAVGPDFKRPDAPQGDSYTATPLPPKTAASEGPAGVSQAYANGADIPAQWWTLFHSDKLNGLVEQALKSSPDVVAAQAALRQAHENLLAQEGSFFPSLDGNGSAARQKVSGASFGQPGGGGSIYSLFNATVNVSYTLDVWGGIRRGVEAQQAQADYQNFQLEATYLTLSSNVVTTAIQEASLRAQIEATNQIIEADRKQLETVKRQLSLGGVSRLDVLTQQTQLANEVATLPPLQKQLQQNRDLLATLLGQLPSQQPDVQFVLDDLQLPQDLPLSLPSQLVAQRPDVRAQEALLHQASAQIGVATANMLPQITISGEFGGTSTNISDLLKSSSNVWSLTGGITQPIFHGGELIHKKRAAVAAYDQAAAQYRGTVLTAFRNVADALHALNADADALQQQDLATQAAADTLKVSRSRYQSGSISSLDLLVVERTYQQARIAQLQAQAARYADTAALFQALGGGWWNRNDTVAQAAPKP
ncbi:efflux transporter outer membrane subunit [Nevskia soli]|uniref:efflux transporter outer membrane subunit n=1 Tax=Nevskia soli TaxID=418856 RepID=UPI0004A7788A|nr:efflux transporter outer membrane subunit [Nevskia soli]